MKSFNWKSILSDLTEAYCELEDLHRHLYYLRTGELPEGWRHDDEHYKQWFEEHEKRYPFCEGTLQVSLEHAFHHLNFAWNSRRTPEKRVYACAWNDFKRWTKLPKAKVFADLWSPRPIDRKNLDLCGSRRKINHELVYGCINAAKKLLAGLCRLVAKEAGDNSRWGESLDGPFISYTTQPLTEKEFADTMHRIYERLNHAWNCRRDKKAMRSETASRRRDRFSPVFM